MPEPNREERLQKVLADAGIGSRRQCEKYIAQGRVSIDGRTVTEMGVKVDPSQHRVLFDAKSIRAERKEYFLLNKPRGYLCTLAEEDTGRRVIDLMKGVARNLRMAGRLDRDSEGLIILTNDGELINILTHPRHEVAKTYWVKVDNQLDSEDIEAMMRGVYLAEGRARATHVHVISSTPKETTLTIVLKQGINRQIRRMLAKLDHTVKQLRRVAIGGIRDPGLKPGRYRHLTSSEVEQLYGAASPAPAERKGRPAAKRGRRPERAARR